MGDVKSYSIKFAIDRGMAGNIGNKNILGTETK